MAEFCSNCASHYGMGVDISISEIFKALKPGQIESVFCEGCELVAVGKTNEGKLKLTFLDRQKSKDLDKSV